MFVKGLHFIEMRYKEELNQVFGIGSPFPTYKVIEALQKQNEELATKLSTWIKENGGNYYIKKRHIVNKINENN